ncbi:hypothetical protein Pst134EB_018240 [Puccinia striiformis f. sp. tritici]|uniref:DUF4187 domain-containing protein n=1 Tax=Puccinia striiformis f. sp. tritici PST-78 TaxID=1165861 RepID=A0A0L0VNS3_9BASI|nr:hypothetical protein Pst134EB_018240 [Puccinia striiformis f. sp. tritici]KNF00665.1 hypothetical protein PSTG_06078 [Puccinia striiformis f. sp. tritici PST-78]
MSDKFLKQITESPSENHKTYTEKRKRRLLEASTTRQKRSGAQREIKAQEEGLSRNSIQSTTSNSSKEPINIVTRCGRAGIGISLKLVPAAKLPRLISGPEGELKLTGEESAQREAFLSSSRSCSDGRKVDAILGRACRTCEELDCCCGLDSNIFWEKTSHSQEEKEPRLTALDRLILNDRQNDPDNLILDDDDDDDKEQQNWLALEPSTRLSCTLGYLREEYFYCIWCGLWPIVGHPRATSVTGTNRPSRATHGQHIHDGKSLTLR